jgi:hypothetical protein
MFLEVGFLFSFANRFREELTLSSSLANDQRKFATLLQIRAMHKWAPTVKKTSIGSIPTID